jgi:hypothetical protein
MPDMPTPPPKAETPEILPETPPPSQQPPSQGVPPAAFVALSPPQQYAAEALQQEYLQQEAQPVGSSSGSSSQVQALSGSTSDSPAEPESTSPHQVAPGSTIVEGAVQQKTPRSHAEAARSKAAEKAAVPVRGPGWRGHGGVIQGAADEEAGGDGCSPLHPACWVQRMSIQAAAYQIWRLLPVVSSQRAAVLPAEVP